jgi:hypothetical protein
MTKKKDDDKIMHVDIDNDGTRRLTIDKKSMKFGKIYHVKFCDEEYDFSILEDGTLKMCYDH